VEGLGVGTPLPGIVWRASGSWSSGITGYVFVKGRSDVSEAGNSEQPDIVDPDEQDVDPAVSSPAEQAQERQKEMEESGQENPA
jgi:hypothetical protein